MTPADDAAEVAAARERRRTAYRTRERVRISRAFDSFMADLYGEVFEERYGVPAPLCPCADDPMATCTPSPLHHNGHYGAPDC